MADAVPQKHLVFEVEVPGFYLGDVDEMREFQGDASESDFLLDLCGEPGVVRIRMEIGGDKDSSVVEVWGSIRAARLAEPSKGYEAREPHLTDEQLAANGWKLMRLDRGCE